MDNVTLGKGKPPPMSVCKRFSTATEATMDNVTGKACKLSRSNSAFCSPQALV